MPPCLSSGGSLQLWQHLRGLCHPCAYLGCLPPWDPPHKKVHNVHMLQHAMHTCPTTARAQAVQLMSPLHALSLPAVPAWGTVAYPHMLSSLHVSV